MITPLEEQGMLRLLIALADDFASEGKLAAGYT
jgi:hypothetical protein